MEKDLYNYIGKNNKFILKFCFLFYNIYEDTSLLLIKREGKGYGF